MKWIISHKQSFYSLLLSENQASLTKPTRLGFFWFQLKQICLERLHRALLMARGHCIRAISHLTWREMWLPLLISWAETATYRQQVVCVSGVRLGTCTPW